MNEIKINEEFCFDSNKQLTVKIAQTALKKYAEKFSLALQLDQSIPVILDTNVLLAYYGLSQVEKNKLLEFLNQNKDRIFITPQIEKEFLKNRIATIKKDFFNPLENITKDFDLTYQEIRNKFRSFLDKNKNTLSNDYPEIWELLSEKQQKLHEILENDEQYLKEKISQVIETTAADYKHIYVVDKLLEVCSELKITPALDDTEVDFIKKQYDDLWKIYDAAKPEKRLEITFPGCGDKLNKENPYGDFIIFHEILKFMTQGENGSDRTDVIFLTREKTKGDWIYKDLSPIIHYIIKAFLVTEQNLFILNPDKPLEMSFENIHNSNQFTDRSPSIRESTILNLNPENKYGFVYSRQGNLYFNDSFMVNPAEFHLLAKNDVVQYEIGKNQSGEEIAINVKKVLYSFTETTKKIVKGTVFRIYKDKGFGFISAQPENLYFHYSFLENSQAFNDLEVDSSVEYIVGKNEFGDNIARLVRKVL